MSALWDVFVINKGEKWIDLKVRLRHPDAGLFSESSVFSLLLLTDEAYSFDEKYNRIASSPLGEQIKFEKSYLPYDVAPRVSEFIVKTIIYKTINVPYSDDLLEEQISAKLIEQGFDEDEDEEEWEIQKGKLWDKFWDNHNNMPHAWYRIYVTDEKWINHLKVGDNFDSAAYAEDGPWISSNIETKL